MVNLRDKIIGFLGINIIVFLVGVCLGIVALWLDIGILAKETLIKWPLLRASDIHKSFWPLLTQNL